MKSDGRSLSPAKLERLKESNDAFVTLTGHPEKNGDIVAKNLEILKQLLPKDQKLE